MASFYMRGSSLTPVKINQQEDKFPSSTRPVQVHTPLVQSRALVHI